MAGGRPERTRPGTPCCTPLHLPRRQDCSVATRPPLPSCPWYLCGDGDASREPSAACASGPGIRSQSFCVDASLFVPQVWPPAGKAGGSTRLDELGTGRKWKRKPVPSIADKAGGRAAYSCPQPPAAPAQGPSHQGLSRGSHLRGRQGPVAWPAVGEGSRNVSGTEGRSGDQWGSIDSHLSPHLTQSGMDMRPGRGRRRRGGLSCCGGQGELALSDAWPVLILLEMIMS